MAKQRTSLVPPAPSGGSLYPNYGYPAGGNAGFYDIVETSQGDPLRGKFRAETEKAKTEALKRQKEEEEFRIAQIAGALSVDAITQMDEFQGLTNQTVNDLRNDANYLFSKGYSFLFEPFNRQMARINQKGEVVGSYKINERPENSGVGFMLRNVDPTRLASLSAEDRARYERLVRNYNLIPALRNRSKQQVAELDDLVAGIARQTYDPVALDVYRERAQALKQRIESGIASPDEIANFSINDLKVPVMRMEELIKDYQRAVGEARAKNSVGIIDSRGLQVEQGSDTVTEAQALSLAQGLMNPAEPQGRGRYRVALEQFKQENNYLPGDPDPEPEQVWAYFANKYAGGQYDPSRKRFYFDRRYKETDSALSAARAQQEAKDFVAGIYSQASGDVTTGSSSEAVVLGKARTVNTSVANTPGFQFTGEDNAGVSRNPSTGQLYVTQYGQLLVGPDGGVLTDAQIAAGARPTAAQGYAMGYAVNKEDAARIRRAAQDAGYVVEDFTPTGAALGYRVNQNGEYDPTKLETLPTQFKVGTTFFRYPVTSEKEWGRVVRNVPLRSAPDQALNFVRRNIQQNQSVGNVRSQQPTTETPFPGMPAGLEGTRPAQTTDISQTAPQSRPAPKPKPKSKPTKAPTQVTGASGATYSFGPPKK